MTTEAAAPEVKPDILVDVRRDLAAAIAANDKHFARHNGGWLDPELERNTYLPAGSFADLTVREDFPIEALAAAPAAAALVQVAIARQREDSEAAGSQIGEAAIGNVPPAESFFRAVELFREILESLRPSSRPEPKLETVQDFIAQGLNLDQLVRNTGLPRADLLAETANQEVKKAQSLLASCHRMAGVELAVVLAEIPDLITLDPHQYPVNLEAAAERVQGALVLLPRAAELRAIVKSARASGFLD